MRKILLDIISELETHRYYTEKLREWDGLTDLNVKCASINPFLAAEANQTLLRISSFVSNRKNGQRKDAVR